MHTTLYRGTVLSVCIRAEAGLPKSQVDDIELIESYGINGDYHTRKFMRQRDLENKEPNKPNNRQVLLVDTSIFSAIEAQGIQLDPGMLGENIIVDGISLMELPSGTRLEIGESILELTEVRRPCSQLNEIHPNLLQAVTNKVAGKVRFNAGMMARIIKGGLVKPGDLVSVDKNYLNSPQNRRPGKEQSNQ
jgi:MOSC domain-containing protein YiiM